MLTCSPFCRPCFTSGSSRLCAATYLPACLVPAVLFPFSPLLIKSELCLRASHDSTSTSTSTSNLELVIQIVQVTIYATDAWFCGRGSDTVTLQVLASHLAQWILDRPDLQRKEEPFDPLDPQGSSLQPRLAEPFLLQHTQFTPWPVPLCGWWVFLPFFPLPFLWLRHR